MESFKSIGSQWKEARVGVMCSFFTSTSQEASNGTLEQLATLHGASCHLHTDDVMDTLIA